MMQDDFTEVFDLGQDAGNSTWGSVAKWLGFLAMLVLALFTAVHAIHLAAWNRATMPESGDLFTWLQIGGVVLVEVFAFATGVMLLTHRVRAKQKPIAMLIEISWLAFAAMNLVSSFAVERTGEIPQFVSSWVTYGLPISALVMGAQFWIMLRLDPDLKRAQDEAELFERFTAVKHRARLEVLASPQMNAVVRQMTWQQLPPVIGRQLNLSDEQIAALIHQAPELLDMRGKDQRQPVFTQAANSSNGRSPKEL